VGFFILSRREARDPYCLKLILGMVRDCLLGEEASFFQFGFHDRNFPAWRRDVRDVRQQIVERISDKLSFRLSAWIESVHLKKWVHIFPRC
jgi:hypothetical protein